MLPLRLEPCAGPPEGAPRPRRGMPRLRRSCGPAAGQEGGIPLPGQRRQSQPLQQVLMHLDRAVRDAFDRKSPQRFPVFKKKFVCADSLRYFQSRTVEGVAQLVRGGPDRGRDPRAAAPVPEHGGRRPRCGALPNPVRRHRVPAAQLFRETGTAPGPGRAPPLPQGQGFPELAQAEGRDHRTAYPDRRRQQRLPAQGLQRRQQKPRCRGAGGAAGGQHERIGPGDAACAGVPGPAEGRSEPRHPGPGVGRVHPPAGIQRVLAGRAGALRRCGVHQPKVLALRAVRPGEPDGTGELRVSFLTAWRPMPTTTRRSTFWRRGTPSSPVESTAQQGRSTKQEPQEPLRRKPHRPLRSPSFRTGRMSSS